MAELSSELLSSPRIIDSIQAFGVSRRVSRRPSRLPKDEIAQPLHILLSKTPQLVHREGATALLIDQGIAGDGVGPVKLTGAAVERQPLGVAVLVDQHHRPEIRRQLVRTTTNVKGKR